MSAASVATDITAFLAEGLRGSARIAVEFDTGGQVAMGLNTAAERIEGQGERLASIVSSAVDVADGKIDPPHLARVAIDGAAGLIEEIDHEAARIVAKGLRWLLPQLERYIFELSKRSLSADTMTVTATL